MLDFGGILAKHRNDVLNYIDMSPQGSFLEAINNLYDVLRIAETHESASFVLITDILVLTQQTALDQSLECQGKEHFEALFDRIFRATSGNKA